ncbi:MAG TPA: murein biosynthesis integral membrane protein MurJ [Bryobacteraceae bacterium]|nr:murein biosynthesis integral membrane protein MurJ [Bryobacteraceae bacterium]
MLVRIRISPPVVPKRRVASLSTPSETVAAKKQPLGASSRVAFGILISRITGLARETVMAYFLGNSRMAGIFRAAFRIPNLLSNLFGEGVLSAAFITMYSKLRANGQDEDAEHLAAAVFGVLATVSASIVLVGVLFTPWIIDLIAAGFKGEDRLLTIRLVRILFPGAGLLVMSAWCLGVLNSHRRFLLSYAAPVAMNATMIAALFIFGGSAPVALVTYLSWACVLGSGLQFLVQLPHVLQLLPHFRPNLDFQSEHTRIVVRNFGPVFVSRGVVQISAYIDQLISSFLGPIAVSTLSYGQFIATFPVSMFSMSISAAELPVLSSATGTAEQIAEALRTRLQAGLRRIAFFIVPSAVALLLLGDVLAAGLFRMGRFHQSDAEYVWAALAGSSVGLLATSLGRLYSSAFYALLDTKTPLRFAMVRVALTTALGWLFALLVPHALGLALPWSLAGLTASAGFAGWVEFVLLRRALVQRIGNVSLPPAFLFKLWAIAGIAGACGYVMKLLIGVAYPRLLVVLVVAVYGVVYVAGTSQQDIDESKQTLQFLYRRLRI